MKTFFPTLGLFLLIFSSTQAQVTNGLISNYSFNSATVNDDQGNNNAVNDGATFGTDRFGNIDHAIQFEGPGNPQSIYVTSPIIALNTDFAISYWMYFDSINTGDAQYTITSRFDSTNNEQGGVDMAVGSNSVLYGYFKLVSSVSISTMPGDTMAIENWYHVVIMKEANVSRLYMNNLLVSTDTMSQSIPNVDFWRMGAGVNINGYNRAMDGKLDDIRYYNRSLNALEVDSLYNMANPMASSIRQTSSFAPIMISPNPAQNDLNIQLENQNFDRIEIIDIQGRSNSIAVQATNQHQLTISQYPAGIYVLRLFSDDKIQAVQRFVKQ